jgi:hypothetical protein
MVALELKLRSTIVQLTSMPHSSCDQTISSTFSVVFYFPVRFRNNIRIENAKHRAQKKKPTK